MRNLSLLRRNERNKKFIHDLTFQNYGEWQRLAKQELRYWRGSRGILLRYLQFYCNL